MFFEGLAAATVAKMYNCSWFMAFQRMQRSGSFFKAKFPATISANMVALASEGMSPMLLKWEMALGGGPPTVLQPGTLYCPVRIRLKLSQALPLHLASPLIWPMEAGGIPQDSAVSLRKRVCSPSLAARLPRPDSPLKRSLAT